MALDASVGGYRLHRTCSLRDLTAAAPPNLDEGA